MSGKRLVVDVHTHVYPPRYLSLLRARSSLPRIRPGAKSTDPERLIILPDEDKAQSTSSGRPVGPEYYDINFKLSFMKRHSIDISVISLANPWLDFLPSSSDTLEMTKSINDDLQLLCTQHPKSLYAFGVLPSAASPVTVWLDTLQHISRHSHIKGVILGTKGLGKGLDDPDLDPIWSQLQKLKLMTFIHPHYGIGKETYGELENGHVLPLALGFPFETTIAISRLILAGTFDKFPDLRILLAHSGGTIPFLAGRLDSCVAHDPTVRDRLKHEPSWYLKKMYYDGVGYHAPALKLAKELVGADRIMFGTDNPFFPPLTGDPNETEWESVKTNVAAAEEAFTETEFGGVMGGNAIEILGLH